MDVDLREQAVRPAAALRGELVSRRWGARRWMLSWCLIFGRRGRSRGSVNISSPARRRSPVAHGHDIYLQPAPRLCRITSFDNLSASTRN